MDQDVRAHELKIKGKIKGAVVELNSQLWSNTSIRYVSLAALGEQRNFGKI